MKISKQIRILAIVMVLSAISFSAYASSPDDLRQKINAKNEEILKLEKEIKEYRESVAEKEQVAQTLQGEIRRLDQESKSLGKQIILTQAKISKKELDIRVLQGDIGDAQQALWERQRLLKENLRALSDIENRSVVELFIEYKSVSGFLDALESNKALENSVRETYDTLKELKERLKTQKQDAEGAKRQLLALRGDLIDERALQEESKTQKAQLLKTTKNQEARYQKLLRDREAQRAAIVLEIQKIETELRGLIDITTLPRKGSKILHWPVDNPVITQEFGQTEFSKNTDVYRGNGHNGIDLKASYGTNIYAAASGIVKEIGNTDATCPGGSYGKWVVIDHPNNLSTLYAHLSRIKIVPGSTVSGGDIIGLSGNSGYTTGPHLHFTVYATNTFRLAQTRHCGLVPAGGYINPIDYF